MPRRARSTDLEALSNSRRSKKPRTARRGSKETRIQSHFRSSKNQHGASKDEHDSSKGSTIKPHMRETNSQDEDMKNTKVSSTDWEPPVSLDWHPVSNKDVDQFLCRTDQALCQIGIMPWDKDMESLSHLSAGRHRVTGNPGPTSPRRTYSDRRGTSTRRVRKKGHRRKIRWHPNIVAFYVPILSFPTIPDERQLLEKNQIIAPDSDNVHSEPEEATSCQDSKKNHALKSTSRMSDNWPETILQIWEAFTGTAETTAENHQEHHLDRPTGENDIDDHDEVRVDPPHKRLVLTKNCFLKGSTAHQHVVEGGEGDNKKSHMDKGASEAPQRWRFWRRNRHGTEEEYGTEEESMQSEDNREIDSPETHLDVSPQPSSSFLSIVFPLLDALESLTNCSAPIPLSQLSEEIEKYDTSKGGAELDSAEDTIKVKGMEEQVSRHTFSTDKQSRSAFTGTSRWKKLRASRWLKRMRNERGALSRIFKSDKEQAINQGDKTTSMPGTRGATLASSIDDNSSTAGSTDEDQDDYSDEDADSLNHSESSPILEDAVTTTENLWTIPDYLFCDKREEVSSTIGVVTFSDGRDISTVFEVSGYLDDQNKVGASKQESHVMVRPNQNQELELSNEVSAVDRNGVATPQQSILLRFEKKSEKPCHESPSSERGLGSPSIRRGVVSPLYKAADKEASTTYNPDFLNPTGCLHHRTGRELENMGKTSILDSQRRSTFYGPRRGTRQKDTKNKFTTPSRRCLPIRRSTVPKEREVKVHGDNSPDTNAAIQDEDLVVVGTLPWAFEEASKVKQPLSLPLLGAATAVATSTCAAAIRSSGHHLVSDKPTRKLLRSTTTAVVAGSLDENEVEMVLEQGSCRKGLISIMRNSTLCQKSGPSSRKPDSLAKKSVALDQNAVNNDELEVVLEPMSGRKRIRSRNNSFMHRSSRPEGESNKLAQKSDNIVLVDESKLAKSKSKSLPVHGKSHRLMIISTRFVPLVIRAISEGAISEPRLTRVTSPPCLLAQSLKDAGGSEIVNDDNVLVMSPASSPLPSPSPSSPSPTVAESAWDFLKEYHEEELSCVLLVDMPLACGEDKRSQWAQKIIQKLALPVISWNNSKIASKLTKKLTGMVEETRSLANSILAPVEPHGTANPIGAASDDNGHSQAGPKMDQDAMSTATDKEKGNGSDFSSSGYGSCSVSTLTRTTFQTTQTQPSQAQVKSLVAPQLQVQQQRQQLLHHETEETNGNVNKDGKTSSAAVSVFRSLGWWKPLRQETNAVDRDPKVKEKDANVKKKGVRFQGHVHTNKEPHATSGAETNDGRRADQVGEYLNVRVRVECTSERMH